MKNANIGIRAPRENGGYNGRLRLDDIGIYLHRGLDLKAGRAPT